MKGGKNFKKAGKRKSKNPNEAVPTDTGCDFYAVVNSKLGGNQFEVTLLIPQQVVHAIIPGKFKRKVWINKGDYVHVKKFYDVYEIYQKIEREDEKDIARQIHYKYGGGDDIFTNKTDKDINITNDISESESDDNDNDDDMMPKSESDSDDDSDDDSESNSDDDSKPEENNKIPKKNIPKSARFDESKLRKGTVSAGKLLQKMKDKERDIAHRTDIGFSENPESFIEKKKSDSENSEDKSDIDIDDI